MRLPLQLVLRHTTCNYAWWCHWRMACTAPQRDGATAAWQVQSSGRVRRAGTPGYAIMLGRTLCLLACMGGPCWDALMARPGAWRRAAAVPPPWPSGSWRVACLQPTARPSRLGEHAALSGPAARACSLLPGRPPERAATLCDGIGFGGISRRPPQGRIAGMRHQAEGESSLLPCCPAAANWAGGSRSRR